MTRKQIIKLITKEVRRAKAMHPRWPTPSLFKSVSSARIEEAAINAEEAFEALQVALNMRSLDPHRGGPKGTDKAYRKELIQNGAMVFRVLERL